MSISKMNHLLKPIRTNMTVVYIEDDSFPKKLGKFPDYLTKGLQKPSFISSKVRGVYQLGKILYKTGAWKKVMRYYAIKNRYRIGGVAVGGGVIGALSPFPTTNPYGQTRNQLEQPRTKRKRRDKCRTYQRRTSRY